MPRDGALTLSDVRSPTLAIVCEPGGRRGRYRLDRLMAEQGDAMLPRTCHPNVQAAACHVPKAFSRKTRSARRDVRWPWTLKVFWMTA
jgi:hypothetical protein